ncbi:MAG: hypothetical protein HOQ11_03805 [Gemmatimonadaceae bacterium]|nr:hypothetical protein [Gemmatimonadaceae bacterium]NUQ92067.1 hypothetical protein [Gemmatimonadaceae bacterium]NUR20082.1 hypothetical protein [Gemmatimonadaceae bacterium]NUS96516.1 hypothetical protein [Gemmatimonadaceae bacterium]
MREDEITEARRRGPDDRDLSRAREDLASQLERRDVPLREDDTADTLVRVLEAVESFERAVEKAGGDLMNNQLRSRDPENPAFVLPRRGEDEGASAYADRVRAAAARIGRAD